MATAQLLTHFTMDEQKTSSIHQLLMDSLAPPMLVRSVGYDSSCHIQSSSKSSTTSTTKTKHSRDDDNDDMDNNHNIVDQLDDDIDDIYDIEPGSLPSKPSSNDAVTNGPSQQQSSSSSRWLSNGQLAAPSTIPSYTFGGYWHGNDNNNNQHHGEGGGGKSVYHARVDDDPYGLNIDKATISIHDMEAPPVIIYRQATFSEPVDLPPSLSVPFSSSMSIASQHYQQQSVVSVVPKWSNVNVAVDSRSSSPTSESDSPIVSPNNSPLRRAMIPSPSSPSSSTTQQSPKTLSLEPKTGSPQIAETELKRMLSRRPPLKRPSSVPASLSASASTTPPRTMPSLSRSFSSIPKSSVQSPSRVYSARLSCTSATINNSYDPSPFALSVVPLTRPALPILRKPDYYYCSHAPDEDMVMIDNWSMDQLSCVDHFTIVHRYYGNIRWTRPVDVRSLLLDDVITFGNNCTFTIGDTVINNPNHVLNSPAIITMTGVWPLDRQTGLRLPYAANQHRVRRIANFESKLRDSVTVIANHMANKIRTSKGSSNAFAGDVATLARFLSYNHDNGTWKFRVAHF
jgi:hypothetical protein